MKNINSKTKLVFWSIAMIAVLGAAYFTGGKIGTTVVDIIMEEGKA